VANQNSSDVSVLFGHGDGTFADEQRFAAGNDPQSVGIGDLNGDENADLIVANSGSRNVSILLNRAPDCNANGIVDAADIADGTSFDCDGNRIPDECDLAAGGDADGDGVLDACQARGDLNGDGCVDLSDLGVILANFGLQTGATRGQGDLDADGDIDLADLGLLLSNFGACGP